MRQNDATDFILVLLLLKVNISQSFFYCFCCYFLLTLNKYIFTGENVSYAVPEMLLISDEIKIVYNENWYTYNFQAVTVWNLINL